MRAENQRAGFLTGLTLLVPISLSAMAVVLLAPVMPQLLSAFRTVPGADYLVPAILTLPALCIAVLSPVAGYIGDRFGRRPMLIAALACYGVVGVAPLILTDLTAILASRAAVGVAETFIIVATTTLLGDFFDGEERDRWLAAQATVASLSALLFFNVGGVIGQFGWRAPFWGYASALVMLAAVLAFTWEPTRRREVAVGATNAGFPVRTMAIIVPTMVGLSALFYTVPLQAAIGLAAHHVNQPAQAGFLISVVSLGVPLGTVIYTRLKGQGVWRLLALELALFGVGFVIMGRAHDAFWFLFGCAINQLGGGLMLPTMAVWTMNALGADVRTRGIGLLQSAFALGQFLSPIIVALIGRSTGGLLSSLDWLGRISLFVALALTLYYLLPFADRLTAAPNHEHHSG